MLVCSFSDFFRTVSQAALWLQICPWSMSLLRDLGWEASASLRWLKVRRKLLPVFKPSHQRLLVQVVLHGNPEKKALDSRLLTTSFGQSLWTTRRKSLSVMSGALVSVGSEVRLNTSYLQSYTKESCSIPIDMQDEWSVSHGSSTALRLHRLQSMR